MTFGSLFAGIGGFDLAFEEPDQVADANEYWCNYKYPVKEQAYES